MRRSLLLAFAATAALLTAGPACAGVAAGQKIIVNATKYTIGVQLWQRESSQPCCVSVGLAAVASIAPGQSATVTYGDSTDPDLNELQVHISEPGKADIYSIFITTQAAAGKTLDTLFNTNSVIVVGYSATTFTLTLAGHN